MNKHGFTLIELLATIAIMAFITTILSINILNILDEKKSYALKNEEEILTNAASTYINLSQNKALKKICQENGCTILFNDLKKEGLINNDDIDLNKDVYIYFENKEEKFILK